MGLADWLRSLFSSPLQRAIDTLPAVDDDGLPSRSHQAMVHRLATEYLTCCRDAIKMEKRREKMEAAFDKHPLLGMEVLDEVLVLYKNQSKQWRQIKDLYVAAMALRYQQYDGAVTRLRGGRIRETTTPTLRGGGKRS